MGDLIPSSGRVGISLIPRLSRGEGKESLVSTACACTKISISKIIGYLSGLAEVTESWQKNSVDELCLSDYLENCRNSLLSLSERTIAARLQNPVSQ